MFPLGMGGSKKRHDVSVWSSASTVSALPLLEELSFAIVKGLQHNDNCRTTDGRAAVSRLCRPQLNERKSSQNSSSIVNVTLFIS
jgi:hypothetical protein